MKPQPPWSSASADGSGRILSNIVRSQTEEHARVRRRGAGDRRARPCRPARRHRRPRDEGSRRRLCADLSAVAAAAGPGLIGGVIVGLTTAKAIAMVHDTPLIAVNHLEAHALTPRLTCALAFPYCLFLASGGHTQIVAVIGVGEYVRLGTTVDDAMGEAFDKVAKMLGAALSGRTGGRARRARRRRQALCLSAADARTRRCQFLAVGIEDRGAQRGQPARCRWSRRTSAISAPSFQAAVLESTADRLSVGLRLFHEQFGPPRALVAAGGVAANQAIRGALQDVAAKAADHADHSAARALHRQWRDDRLGRRRTAGARPDRYHGRAAPRALAARRQCDGAGRFRQHPRGILDAESRSDAALSTPSR